MFPLTVAWRCLTNHFRGYVFMMFHSSNPQPTKNATHILQRYLSFLLTSFLAVNMILVASSKCSCWYIYQLGSVHLLLDIVRISYPLVLGHCLLWPFWLRFQETLIFLSLTLTSTKGGIVLKHVIYYSLEKIVGSC